MDLETGEYISSLVVMRYSKKQQKLVEKKDKKLGSIYKHLFGNEIEDAHFALSDVKALALILRELF